MGIMEEHPLDMTALVNPNRNDLHSNSTFNDGTQMCGIQQQKQRFVQPSVGCVTMGIMEERPMDMRALVNPNRNHSLPQPSTKNATPSVKEELIMYFQQQQKMRTQQQHQGATSASGGSKENGGIFRPLSNGGNSEEHAASKWHKAPEWHPQSNIPLLATVTDAPLYLARFAPHPTPDETMASRPKRMMAAHEMTDWPSNLLLRKQWFFEWLVYSLFQLRTFQQPLSEDDVKVRFVVHPAIEKDQSESSKPGDGKVKLAAVFQLRIFNHHSEEIWH
ncbi:hypothetical protein niasHT_030955 [Heterodera trifolii]|uniref:Uncharacterized protein n=1 Tax=Heterodera trifolii TaxID=157864 RepID=A0ABD2J8D6_9BILA